MERDAKGDVAEHELFIFFATIIGIHWLMPYAGYNNEPQYPRYIVARSSDIYSMKQMQVWAGSTSCLLQLGRQSKLPTAPIMQLYKRRAMSIKLQWIG